MQIGFVFFLRMFQDICNRDCNCDYFQCNRSRLHLCWNRSMSALFIMPLSLGRHFFIGKNMKTKSTQNFLFLLDVGAVFR